MAPNENILDVLKGWDDGYHVEVPNSIKMFLIITLVIKAVVQMLKPRGAEERIDFQHIEV